MHKSFVPGKIFYVRDLTIAQTTGGALKSKFTAPFVVEEVNETRLECTLQSLKDRKRCIRHMTHLKKQEQLDNNNFVPAGLKENNLTSDDIDHSNNVGFVAELRQDIDTSPDPLRAVDEIETEPLYQESESNEDLPRESLVGTGHSTIESAAGQKRKSSLVNVMPTRKSARIRAHDYSHSEVTI